MLAEAFKAGGGSSLVVLLCKMFSPVVGQAGLMIRPWLV